MNAKLNKTVTIYTLLMLIVFPLFMVHTYYDIQTVKMYLYQLSTLAAGIVCAITASIYIFRDKSVRKAFLDGIKPDRLKEKLKLTDIFALIFLIAVVVSTFTSEWVYEAFWGNVGRYQGGYMLSLFVLSYFLITRYYVPKKWHIDAMLAAGVILCAWGVLDYFSLSPIGFGYETLFSSTIGNIDVLTSIEVMYVAVASVMYIAEKPADKISKRRSVFYLVSTFICFMGLECGRTANLLLSTAFLICFIPFYAFGKARGIINYITVLAAYLAAMLLVALLVAAFPNMACAPDYMGELDAIGNSHPKQLLLLILVLIAVRLILAKLLSGYLKEDTCKPSLSEAALAKRLRAIWGTLGVIAFIILVYVFYDANTGGHPELYAPARHLLIFDEAWGTNRGYVWGLAMKYFGDFSWLKKLFGSGPETFAVYVMKYDLNATLRVFDASYDSIHNEWIQHLFECGIVGFIGFYGMTAGACIKGLKTNKCTAALSFAAMAYFIQSFVNISVPLVLPFVIVCLAVSAARECIEDEE